MDIKALEKLLELKEKGILTEIEFESEKEKLKTKGGANRSAIKNTNSQKVQPTESGLPWWAIIIIFLGGILFVLVIIGNILDYDEKTQSTISEIEDTNTQMIVDLFGSKYEKKMFPVYNIVNEYMTVGTRKEKDIKIQEVEKMVDKEITDLDMVVLATLFDVYKTNKYGIDWENQSEETVIKMLKAFGSSAYIQLQTEENIINRHNLKVLRMGVFGALYNHKAMPREDVLALYKEYFDSVSIEDMKIELGKFESSWKKSFSIHQ